MGQKIIFCIGKRGKSPQKQESCLFCKVSLYERATEMDLRQQDL